MVLSAPKARFQPPTYAECIFIIVCGSFGLIACMPILVLNTCRRGLRRAPGRYVRSRTFFILLHTVLMQVYAAWNIARPSHGTSCIDPHDATVADALLMGADAFESGASLWQLAQVMHLLTIVRDPFRPRRYERKLTVFVCVATAAEPVAVALSMIKRAETSGNPTSGGSGGGGASPCATLMLSDALVGSVRFWLCVVDIAFVAIVLVCTTMLLGHAPPAFFSSFLFTRRLTVKKTVKKLSLHSPHLSWTAVCRRV